MIFVVKASNEVNSKKLLIHKKKKILAVIGVYIPGFRGGGPPRSLSNLAERLGQELEFYIATADRDLGSNQPFPNLEPNQTWRNVGKAQVSYLPPPAMRIFRWRQFLQSCDFDVLYLNSFFSPLSIKTVILHKLGFIAKKPLILAPRGEFSSGAIALKPFKKRLFIFVAKRLGLYKGVVWQATANNEKLDIQRIIGQNAAIVLAPNLPAQQKQNENDDNLRSSKKPGSAHLVFLSRIARKKNLDVALKLLESSKGSIIFDIYGPIEDAAYWRECQTIINRLPANIKVSYNGPANPEDVKKIFAKYHLFLFPTRGENFGHVIFEALQAGCMTLLSDQTPWRDLRSKRVGWDLPLSDLSQFSAALSEAVDMDEQTFDEWSRLARALAYDYAQNTNLIEASRQMFEQL